MPPPPKKKENCKVARQYPLGESVVQKMLEVLTIQIMLHIGMFYGGNVVGGEIVQMAILSDQSCALVN